MLVKQDVVSQLELTSADNVLRLLRAESFLAIQSRRCPIKSAPLERVICIRDSKVTEYRVSQQKKFCVIGHGSTGTDWKDMICCLRYSTVERVPRNETSEKKCARLASANEFCVFNGVVERGNKYFANVSQRGLRYVDYNGSAWPYRRTGYASQGHLNLLQAHLS